MTVRIDKNLINSQLLTNPLKSAHKRLYSRLDQISQQK